MQFDPLNDALVKIYNAEQAGKFDVELTQPPNYLETFSTLCKLPATSESILVLKTAEVTLSTSNFAEPSTDAVPSSHDTVFADKNSKSGRHVISQLRTLVSSF